MRATPSPTQQAVVVMTPSPPSAQKENILAASSSAVSSTDWKSYSSKEISVKVDYPDGWGATLDEGEVVSIVSPKNADTTRTLGISISRAKKTSNTRTLKDFYAERIRTLKESTPSAVISEEKDIKLDEYDGKDFVRMTENKKTREIVFKTTNYFYTVTLEPSTSDLMPVANEILKSIKIQ